MREDGQGVGGRGGGRTGGKALHAASSFYAHQPVVGAGYQLL